KIADAFEKNPEAEMVVGNLIFDYADHTFLRNAEIDYKKIMLPFRYMFPINPVSYFYKRSLQKEVGPFPLENHLTMDYWFLLKAYQKHKLIKIEDYLGTFFMNGFNKTSGADNRKNTHYRVLDHCWKHDRKNLPYYLFNYYKFFYYEKTPFNFKKLKSKARKNLSRAYSILTLKKNKYYSERLFQSARSDYYVNRRFKSTSKVLSSILFNPKSLFQRSRQSFIVQSTLGPKILEKLKTAYFFLTTPPGLPLANKLHYYGTEFKKSNKFVKGNLLLLLTYLVSPRFILKNKRPLRSIRNKFSLRKLFNYLNPLFWARGLINFFRFKKYKSYSSEYYIKAREKYYYHKNFQSVFLLLFSFIIYPPALKNISRLNLFMYSLAGNSLAEKFKFAYHLYKDNPEYTFAHKLNYYGNEVRKEGKVIKGNFILFCAYVLSPKYILKREKIKKLNVVSENATFKIPKHNSSISAPSRLSNYKNHLRNLRSTGVGFDTRFKNSLERSAYRIKRAYHYFRYRKFKAQSKDLYAQAIENYKNNKRFKAAMSLIPSFILYPVSIFNRNKFGLMINTITGHSLKAKIKGENAE
ncbi:MAG: hypothetical protein ABI792_05715, partial [bacterium]